MTTCPNHPDRPSRIESAYGFCTECSANLSAQHRVAFTLPSRTTGKPVEVTWDDITTSFDEMFPDENAS